MIAQRVEPLVERPQLLGRIHAVSGEDGGTSNEAEHRAEQNRNGKRADQDHCNQEEMDQRRGDDRRDAKAEFGAPAASVHPSAIGLKPVLVHLAASSWEDPFALGGFDHEGADGGGENDRRASGAARREQERENGTEGAGEHAEGGATESAADDVGGGGVAK